MAGIGSKPGERRGGRQKGTPNRASIARAAAIALSGLTPLDFLLGVMRDIANEMHVRIDAGKAAAPYVHPKLANIELTGKDGGPLGVEIVRFSDALKNPSAQQLAAPAVSDENVAVARTGLPPRRPALAS